MMAINIFDENGYILKVNLSASECSEYQNADSIKRKEKESPGFISRCLAGLGPNQPGVTTADPTDTGVEDPGHEPPASKKKAKSKKKKTKQDEGPRAEQERARPARPQEGARQAAQAAAAAATRPNVPTPSLPNVPRSRTSRCPNVPAPNVPGVTGGGGSGGQSVDPNAPPRLPAEPMRGRNASSVFANPVLVGAVTVLVIIVAVFLSYNANNGLPFVPTTTLKVRFANGENLVRGNEIRSGGFRIGVVEDMKPVQLSAGRVGAELKLKLDKTIGKVPEDSRWRIRPRSALGLKYLELTEGRSKTAFQDGDTVPLEQTETNVDLDEVFKMFDAKTRRASQENLHGFGDAFAGRGAAVGRTVEEAPRLFEHLEPVARNLADPQTELPNFFKELGDAARIVAPISETNARLFTTMADTWEAIGRDPEALQQFIAKQPPTMDAAISSFQVQRPFLRELTDVLRGLLGRDQRAARRAARHQPGARDRHAGPEARPRAQREARGHVRGAQGPDLGAVDQRRDPRADRHRHHAQPAAALLRPVRHGLQRPDLLLHLPRRALLRGRQHRRVAARAAQLRRPAGRLDRLDRRRRAGQRQRGQGGQQAVPARRPVRRRDHARRPRRLRGRPARLPRAQRPLLRQALQDRAGRAHAGRPGPDLQGPRARARRPDLHLGPGDRAVRRDRPVLER